MICRTTKDSFSPRSLIFDLFELHFDQRAGCILVAAVF